MLALRLDTKPIGLDGATCDVLVLKTWVPESLLDEL